MSSETESASRRLNVAAALSGVLFGAGLVVSGMTLPTKVVGFLDAFGGAWDPSLALVMVGAIGVHAVVHRVFSGRPSPLWATRWSLPTRRDLDARLLLGAALFGLGWGIGGYCPGPGLVSLAGGALSSAVFVGTMLLGMWGTALVEDRTARRAAASLDAGAAPRV
ncbi:MAG: DUF6691 family protein [Bradymonadia bacterium]